MWSRRQVLHGAGAALAMPLVGRAAETSPPPLRFVAWFMPNGFYRDTYRPSDFGPLSTLPDTVSGLAPYADRLTFVSGLRNAGADIADDPHSTSLGAMLTGHAIDPAANTHVTNGKSFDQVLASAWGGRTRLTSLELSSEAPDPCSVLFPPQSDDAQSREYSCAYSSYLSWDGPGSPRPAIIDPRAVFERMFGRVQSHGDEAARARRLRMSASVLDAVMGPLKTWSRTLSTHDRV